MRTGTKNFMTGVSLGLIGVSYAVGVANANQEKSALAASGLGSTAIATAEPTATATATPTPTATATKKASTAKKTTSSTTTKKTTTSTTTKKKTTSSSSSTKAVTKTGGTVNYEYGEVQLTVTRKSGKITDISGTMTYTRGPADLGQLLVDKAIAANGTSFSKVSRATVTTDAFKSALKSALAKF